MDLFKNVEIFQIYIASKMNQKQKCEKKRFCRMGCGSESKPGTNKTPGWPLQVEDEIVKDPRGFKKLALSRNNSRLTQTSLSCLQSWRGNCDIQILVYETDPKNPDPAELTKVSDYVVGYACKGNATLSIERMHVKSFTMRYITSKQKLMCL